MSSEIQMKKKQAHSYPLQTYKRLWIHPSWKNISPALFPSSIYAPWDNSLQNVNKSPEKKKFKGFGLSCMHFSQTHALKNHNHWRLLLLGKLSKQLIAAQMTAAGSRANVPATAQASWLDPTRASYPTEQHVGQAALKITSCNGMENIPNQGCIPGKMPALTQITLGSMNSHG